MIMLVLVMTTPYNKMNYVNSQFINGQHVSCHIKGQATSMMTTPMVKQSSVNSLVTTFQLFFMIVSD